jgi:hypothetical protein
MRRVLAGSFQWRRELGERAMTAIHSEGDSCAPPTRELLESGCSLYEGGNAEAALIPLREAFERERNNARVRSYYGLCLGLVERRFEESVELCQSAAQQEFFNPDLYLNLARLHLGFGFKVEGVRYLRRGLMIDPGNLAILDMLQDLGDRRSPVLTFLPRKHPVNRWLGNMRHRFSRSVGFRWAT